MTISLIVPVSDLATWLGVTFDEDDTPRAAYILNVAQAWAREFANKVWDDPAAVPMTVKGIILAASRREFENPRHVTYDVKGPESTSYSQVAYPPGFYSDLEIKAFRRFRKGGGLWSQATYRDEFSESLGYLYATDVSKPLPMYNPWEPGWEDSVHL